MSDIDRQAMAWMVRQAEGELTGADRAAFDGWYAADIRHQGAFLRARAIHHSLSRATVQESLRPAPERLRREWSEAPWRQARPGRRRVAMAVLALGLAGIGVATLFRATGQETVYATSIGEFRKTPLPDRSVASINSDSVVAVDVSGSLRQVALKKGEAWFEVAKDKNRPFVVEAGSARVLAVGTAFGVRRFPRGVEVAVTEGSVQVWGSAARGTPGRLLDAGQSAFIPARSGEIQIVRQPQEIARRLAWRDGKLIFANQPLSEAVADFNRYSARPIVIADPALDSKTLVGQYRIDASESFARDVGAFLDVPVDIGAERIVIGRADRRQLAP